MKSRPPALFAAVSSRAKWLLRACVLGFVAPALADTLLDTATFNYTGSAQSYTIPSGADRVVIKAWGGGGGGGFYSSGGGGGFATGTYSVSPSQVLTIVVGGRGESSYYGGYNGGGNGGGAAGGGGAGGTHVYSSGGLNLWAGGGGGGGQIYGAGGAGGGSSGSAGGSGVPGGGGTQSAGGSAGSNASAGSAGVGGNGAGSTGYPGGGGGGGFYGGGGGGDGAAGVGGAGGGGGSATEAGSPISSSDEGGSGIYPGGSGDASYPGGNIGYGASFGLYNPGYHGYVIVQAYQHTTMPTINNPGNQTSAQRQSVSTTILASGSPAPTFSASGLPTGLSLNSSSGAITGLTTTPGTYNTTVSATNSSGTSSASFTWTVTAASVVPDASVVPGAVDYGTGQSVTLYRSGTANFGVSYCDGTIWKPDSTYTSLGVQGLGSQTYTPDGGTGTYYWQFRLVDIYGNYTDQWVPFTVGTVPTITLTASATTVNFGQTVTFSSTSSDPDNNLAFHSIWWDQGNGSYWSNAQFANGPYPATGGYTISNSNGACPGAGQTITASFTATASGTYQFLGYGHDNIAGASTQRAITISKATPSGALSAVSNTTGTTGLYTITSGNLAAVFSNPYSGSVGAPTGTVTYTRVDTGATVAAGTQLSAGTYTIRATYAGNTNYNGATVDATFTITGPTVPGSLQAMLIGSTLVTLGWSASTSPAGIASYRIYRNAALIASGVTALSYTDNGLLTESTYSYTVQAVDNNGNVSVISSAVTPTTLKPFELFTPTP